MRRYLLNRGWQSLVTLFLATVVVFLGVRALPGDPALALAGEDRTPEALAAIREQYGLDQSLPVQFWHFVSSALHGDLPINPDGGLKSFGHPVGASGLRMMFEAWLQLRGEAPDDRRIENDRTLALTHNLGGYPGEMVSFVSILGSELG